MHPHAGVLLQVHLGDELDVGGPCKGVTVIVVAVIVVAVIAVQPYSLHQATAGLIGAQFWKAQGMTSNPVCFDFAVLVASNFLLAIIHIHTMQSGGGIFEFSMIF